MSPPPPACVKLCKLRTPQDWKEREESRRRGERLGGGGGCVSGNGKQGGGMRSISDAGPGAVYTAVSLWHQSSDFINVSGEQTAALASQVSETDWAPSATPAPMERPLCDCGIALAVLLCVATQVRPVHFAVGVWGSVRVEEDFLGFFSALFIVTGLFLQPLM